MKPRFLGLLLLFTSFTPSVAFAGKAEADFNDLKLGDTRTRGDVNGDSDLEDAGDTKAVYKLRVTAQGWKSAPPTYQIEILDVAGNPVAASAPGLAIFQSAPPPEGPNRITFAANTGTNAGFWLDDVLIYNTVESEGVTITGISG